MRSNQEYSQTAQIAVTRFSGSPIHDICSGPSSYWAKTFIVKSKSETFFVKITTNPIKGKSSQREPRITKLAQQHEIPCPLALIYYPENAISPSSMPVVIYQYVESQNGEQIAECTMFSNKTARCTNPSEIANVLSQINNIKPETNFLKGIETGSNINYKKIIYDLVKNSSTLSLQQKEIIISHLHNMKTNDFLTTLHHKDFYPGNLLFSRCNNNNQLLQLNSCHTTKPPHLINITDWEKAGVAPKGTDFFGLFATSLQLSIPPDVLFAEYRKLSKLQIKQMKSMLLTFGMMQALMLHNRVQEILAKDLTANKDPKIIRFQNWLDEYLTFAFEYE